MRVRRAGSELSYERRNGLLRRRDVRIFPFLYNITRVDKLSSGGIKPCQASLTGEKCQSVAAVRPAAVPGRSRRTRRRGRGCGGRPGRRRTVTLAQGAAADARVTDHAQPLDQARPHRSGRDCGAVRARRARTPPAGRLSTTAPRPAPHRPTAGSHRNRVIAPRGAAHPAPASRPVARSALHCRSREAGSQPLRLDRRALGRPGRPGLAARQVRRPGEGRPQRRGAARSRWHRSGVEIPRAGRPGVAASRHFSDRAEAGMAHHRGKDRREARLSPHEPPAPDAGGTARNIRPGPAIGGSF